MSFRSILEKLGGDPKWRDPNSFKIKPQIPLEIVG